MIGNEVLKLEKKGHVAWLTINRPEKHNAMNGEVFQGLIDNFRELDNDADVRVVVISGEGEKFTSGIDLNYLAGVGKGSGADDREELRKSVLWLQEAMTAAENCRKPVIAAIHGMCIGVGMDLTTACDIRIAAKDALFSVRETRIAIVADMGTLQRLPGLVGESWYRDIALTGRDFTADEAYQMGLVTKVLEDKDALLKEAERLAEEIASLPPLAVQGVKDMANFTREHGVQASLKYVAQKNAAIVISEDVMEAIAAFMEKRKPVFKGK